MTCSQCGLELSEAGVSTFQPTECPACGKALSPAISTPPSPGNLVKNYFFDVWQIIARPTAFFRHMPVAGGLTRPLCFALVTHWLGSAIGFIWHLVFGGIAFKFIQNISQWGNDEADIQYPAKSAQFLEAKEKIVHWLFGVGPVIIDPFLTLFSVLFTSLIIFAGARILISTRERDRIGDVTYESVVRILCFGMSPAILAALPFLGGFFSTLLTLIVTVIGFKEVYKIGTGRAVIVFLFPKLLFLGILGTGLVVLLAIFFQIFASVF